jgi:hypothetical protein
MVATSEVDGLRIRIALYSSFDIFGTAKIWINEKNNT